MIVQHAAAALRPYNWVCISCRNASKQTSRTERRRYASAAQIRRPSQQLPSTPARTRFAPSPTGYMHLGSLRTALFNYLLAKATGGQFLLRIEDTDTKRTVPGAEQRICQDLDWAGIRWDEGPEVGGPYGPYRQSERTDLYKQHAKDLIETGHGYRCFCSAEKLDKLARARSQLGISTDYDRTCAGIPKEESDDRAEKGESHTIRLKVPDVYPRYDDLVYGRVGGPKQKTKKIVNGELSYEDPILIKSDGLPTYHLANVVDDHHMKITHVVRAIEWMPSTPKHLAMYEALGWTPPQFAHVGLLQDNSRQKLSKRNLDIDIESFRNEGIFPEALVNHVALLGWSHNHGSDFFSLEELVNNFDLKFTKGNTVVNFQKLSHLQKLHAQRFIEDGGARLEEITESVLSLLKETLSQGFRFHVPQEWSTASYVKAVLKADSKQYTSASDFFNRNKHFFCAIEESDRKPLPAIKVSINSDKVNNCFREISETGWNEDSIKSAQFSLARTLLTGNDAEPELAGNTSPIEEHVPDNKRLDDAMTQVSKFLRWAVMNSQPGPPIALSMALLGRQESLSRLRSMGAELQPTPRSGGEAEFAASG